jgi:multidrug efflux system membrane fusion protein
MVVMTVWRFSSSLPVHKNLRVARRAGLGRLVGLVMLVGLTAAACSNTSADPAAAGAAGGKGGRGGRGARGGVQPVVTIKVTQRDVPVDIAAVGNVEAYTSISVRSQVTGMLQETYFHEGDVVKKGDKLFKIDPRPLEAALQQAQANLLRDQSLLVQAEAQLARDAANAQYQQAVAKRQDALNSAGLVSRDTIEQSRAAADSLVSTTNADKAAVESAKQQVTVQQSVVEGAKVQLSYTIIPSPIDGRTGNNTVKVGNLVTANGAELVTIAQLQPIYVTFAVPAAHLPSIKHQIAGEPLPVVATPQDGNAQPVDGQLTFIDNLVDSTTDTIKLKATFTNKDLRLWPGQFTRVSLRLTTLANATVVPSQAVQVGQDGQFVFVVKSDSTVEQRPITVAQRMGEIVVIDKGLQPGETIVTEGQLRLEQGTRVQAGDTNGAPDGGRGGRGRGGRGARGQGGQAGQNGQGGQSGQGQPGQADRGKRGGN